MDQKGQTKSKYNCNPLSQFSKREGMHELDGYHNIFPAEKLARLVLVATFDKKHSKFMWRRRGGVGVPKIWMCVSSIKIHS